MGAAEKSGRRARARAQRGRRAASRRRNALALAALASLIAGAAVGSGTGPPAASGPPAAEAPPAAAGERVTGFEGEVPILMYHAISPAPAGAAYPELFVPQAEFEEQMAWLEDQGYDAVTLAELFAAWEDGEPIAPDPVVLSFDDGLRSQYIGAKPALDRLGWPGVLNLKVEALDQGELTEAEVEEMIASGWGIGSHTFTHRDLTSLDGAELRREVAGSREELERRFGIAVDFFCYPAGRYDDETLAAVEAAGYRGATTTAEGLAAPGNPYELSRIRVVPGDGADGLAAKLSAEKGA